MKLSIGKAWEEASAFLAREGRLVVPVALAAFALPSVLVGWSYANAPAGGGGRVLLMLVVLVAAMIGQMSIVLLSLGWSGSIGEAMGKAARRVPVLLGAVAIVFLPICLIAIIAFGSALVAAGITDPSALTPQVLAKVPNVGWMILLTVVIFIFASVRLFPISAIAANESLGPVGLLRRSWTLTTGASGRLLALLLLLMVAALMLDWAVTAVVGSGVALAIGEPRPFNLAALIVALASGLVGATVAAVSAAMIGRVYAQLSGDKSGAAHS